MANPVPLRGLIYIVGDFMTGKEYLHAVKPTTTVEEALKNLVENRITGFPVIDDDWKLMVSEVSYHTFFMNLTSFLEEVGATACFPKLTVVGKRLMKFERLLTKTNGKVVGELITPSPLLVRETTNLEDAAPTLLLETKYRRLPVVDAEGKLVGIVTRGDVVRAALKINRENEVKG